MAIGEYDVGKDLNAYCIHLVSLHHDALDLTAVPALTHLIANCLYVMDVPITTITGFIMIAESILISRGAKNSEVIYHPKAALHFCSARVVDKIQKVNPYNVFRCITKS